MPPIDEITGKVDDMTVSTTASSLDDDVRQAMTKAATSAAFGLLADGELAVPEDIAHAIAAGITAALDVWMSSYYEVLPSSDD